MVDKVLFKSGGSNDWGTPQWLYDMLDSEFHFTLDPCANDDNAMCDAYFTEAEDGLVQPWGGCSEVVFVNPPYSPWQTAYAWVHKCYDEAWAGARVVALLPVRTSNKWFHDFVMYAEEIRFINGRLEFVGSKYFAPFPSMIVIFRP